MNNIFVYCEITEERTVADVSLELLSKDRKLAEELKCQLEAIVISDKVEGLEQTPGFSRKRTPRFAFSGQQA